MTLLQRVLFRCHDRSGFATKAALMWLPCRTCGAGLLLFFLLLCARQRLFAQHFDEGPILSVIEENDFVDGTDRHYTQGGKIASLQADNHLPHWAKAISSSIPAL